MAAQRMKVTYTDGTVVEVKATPKAQVMTERFLRGQGGFANSTITEASFRLAYESSLPGIGNVGYDEWLDKIEEVEALCAKCGGSLGDDPDEHKCEQVADLEGPTHEAPSPTPSSD